jgi:CHAD domain-containing protein
MARAKRITGLSPDMPMREAAARTIGVRAREVFTYAERVLDTDDIERVHDMRVATRRLRAALEVFAACFPAREHRRVLRDVKKLADALGERRDPDVALATLDRIEAGLAGADRSGIESFRGELRGDQAEGNRSLEMALAEMAESRLQSRLEALTAAARAGA